MTAAIFNYTTMPLALATKILYFATLDFIMTRSVFHAGKPPIHNFLVSGNAIVGKNNQEFWVQKHSNHYLLILLVLYIILSPLELQIICNMEYFILIL